MKIYVASSWRNEFQPEVVKVLRSDGHEVYDFKDSQGFHWSEVDEDWKQWISDIPSYLTGLQHPCAQRGFNRDMEALRSADACVYVMPCGVSASLEAGWACGAGKPLFVYVPGLREPDLMVKMANIVTDKLQDIRSALLLLYPIPDPDGPCPKCGSTDIGFEPFIIDGVSGGDIWCKSCKLSWEVKPAQLL